MSGAVVVLEGGGRDRARWPIGSGRFIRDVLASVLATGLATVAFSHLAHEPPLPRHAPAPGKITDRLAWQTEEIPVRHSRHYDSVAMFGLSYSEPSPWSEPALSEAKPTEPAALSDARRRGVATVLPPGRPATLVVATGFDRPAAPHMILQPEPGRIQLFGWNVPGTDLLPQLPSGRDALQKVASLSDAVASVGDAVAETVGLR